MLLGILWVLSWDGGGGKVSTASFSRAVDFLINLIKAASIQTLFVSEYVDLDLFLQTGKQSHVEKLLSHPV